MSTVGACIYVERLKLQSERTVYLRKVWHNALRNSVQRERHSQLTWKAIDVNFACDILIQDFVMVIIPYLDSSDSESDMSRWSFNHRDSMRTTQPN